MLEDMSGRSYDRDLEQFDWVDVMQCPISSRGEMPNTCFLILAPHCLAQIASISRTSRSFRTIRAAFCSIDVWLQPKT
jgi:hypothetical protein